MIKIEFELGKGKVLLRNSDYSGYEICFQRTQKNQLVWMPEKYYANLETALQKIAELKIKEADSTSLQELANVIKDVRNEIVKVWKFNLEE